MSQRFRAISLLLVICPAIALCACTREVTVDPGTESGAFPVNGPGGAGGVGAPPLAPEPRQPLAGSAAGVGASPPAAGAGLAGPASGAAGNVGSTSAAGSGGPPSVGPSTTLDGGSVDLMSGIDQTNPSSNAIIADVKVLASGLSSIELPAVGSEGVSLLQYSGPQAAFVLYVSLDGAREVRHDSARAHYAYTAASGTAHVALLYATASYGVYENGGMNDVSGSKTAYKEFLAANDRGLAWVEYAANGRAPAGPTSSSQTLGAVVFQTSGGVRSTVTDAERYRARVELSATHVAFVEYASTAAGTPGQIVVQPIAGGAPILAAPSANHQDRPSIDGDWVVWEEYLSTTDAVIRARNLVTSEVRDLSTSAGFRTNPDVRGTRVIWEDQQSGRGDVYFIDLATNAPARPAVTGRGHSSGARLTDGGLVWIEAQGNQIGLLYAHWL